MCFCYNVVFSDEYFGFIVEDVLEIIVMEDWKGLVVMDVVFLLIKVV